MKFIVDSSIISKCIAKHCKIARKSSKDEKSVLSCVKLEAKNGKLKLTSFDGVISYVSFINQDDIEVDEEGCTLVDSTILNSLSKYPKNTLIEFCLIGNNLKTHCRGIDTKLACNALIHEYPEIVIKKPEITFKVNGEILSNSFSKALSHVDLLNAEKPYSECVHMKVSGTTMKIFTIRGEGGMQITNVIDNTDNDVFLSLFGRDLKNVVALLKDTPDDITVGITKNDIIFKINSDYTTLRRANVGKMLFDDIISRLGKDTELSFLANDLKDSVDRALCLIPRKYAIHLKLFKNKIQLLTEDEKGSAIDEKIPCERFSGEDLQIKVNVLFLDAILKNIKNDKVNLYVQNSDSPILITTDDCTEQYLVLPIYLNEQEKKKHEKVETKEEDSNEQDYKEEEKVDEEIQEENQEVNEQVEEEITKDDDAEKITYQEINEEEVTIKSKYEPIPIEQIEDTIEEVEEEVKEEVSDDKIEAPQIEASEIDYSSINYDEYENYSESNLNFDAPEIL